MILPWWSSAWLGAGPRERRRGVAPVAAGPDGRRGSRRGRRGACGRRGPGRRRVGDRAQGALELSDLELQLGERVGEALVHCGQA